MLDTGTRPDRVRPSVIQTALRFGRYSALSVGTVVAGYSLLLGARQLWHVNAGLLNLGVGAVLTGPSFLLYRRLVWNGGGDRGWLVEFGSFVSTVIAGALASSLLMGLTDALWHPSGTVIIIAGLTGQGIVFIARFFWLDLVTFAPREPAG